MTVQMRFSRVEAVRIGADLSQPWALLTHDAQSDDDAEFGCLCVTGAVGGDDDGDDKEKEEEAERERQEAIKEAEDRRKEKHRKMEEEREKMRQEIRDKVFIALSHL